MRGFLEGDAVAGADAIPQERGIAQIEAQLANRKGRLLKSFRTFRPEQYTVLIIESDLFEQNRLDEHLRSSGVKTACVNSAAQAIEVMVRRHIDVVVCSSNLPDFPGDDFAKQLLMLRGSARKGQLPVILLTESDEKSAREAVASGADLVCLREKSREMLIPQVMFLIR